jgi:hypothetical protein
MSFALVYDLVIGVDRGVAYISELGGFISKRDLECSQTILEVN